MRSRSVAAILVAVVGSLVVMSSVAAAPGSPQQSFASCDEAAAAGFTNITSGAPGYSAALDADRDGIACEERAGDAAPAPAALSPDAAVPPAPPAEVLGATESAQQPDALASTGASSWILLAVAVALVLAGRRLVLAGYEFQPWTAGRRYSEVRFTIDSTKPIRKRR